MRRQKILPGLAAILLLVALVRYLPRWIPALDYRSGFLPRPDAVEWVWTGALQPTSIRMVAKLTRPSESVRLLLSRDEGLANPRRSAAHTASQASGLGLSITAAGLEPGTRYVYALEIDGEVDNKRRGTFRTPQEGPQSFTLAFGSCARTGSSHPVFETIRRHDPLFFLHLGDLHYRNIARNDPQRFARAFDTVLRSPAQSRLFRSVPIAYVWDDHDYGPDNSDSTSPSRAAARQAYRRWTPHYPLAEGEGGAIYQAFTIGRVRFLLTDSRSERSPRSDPDGPDKTVLGTAQKAWLERQFLAAKERYPLIVWANSFPWIAPTRRGADDWGGYAHERLEIARFIEANQIRGVIMLSGDAHMLAIDDGSHNRLTETGGPGFPVMHAAPLDQRGSRKGGPYSSDIARRAGQFGLMKVEDNGGSQIVVHWSGRNHKDRELIRHRFIVTE
ncbi:MAG: alkaline phosphatase D family protein [Acidobacteriota bacterium]